MKDRLNVCTKCQKPDPNGQYWNFGDDCYCQICWEDYCTSTFKELIEATDTNAGVIIDNYADLED